MGFVINKANAATISVGSGKIAFEVKSEDTTSSGYFDIDTESEIHIKVDDFNFDGNLDFDVWYFDEGMGVYTIHRIFVFEPSSRGFYEIFPRCGDQFLNLELDRKRRVLYNTFFIHNKPKRCATRFPLH